MPRRYEKNQLIWVSPGSVRYDREDIEFLLPWLHNLREGVGPAEPENGYVGGRRNGVKDHAYFEAWCHVAAEIDRRLSHTGLDRYLVEDIYCKGTSIETLTGLLQMDKDEITRRTENAISYIASGFCARWMECQSCLRNDDCSIILRKEDKSKKHYSYAEWRNYKNKEYSRKLKYTKKVYSY